MADVLSVIQDVLNQDKMQKREHAKMMREVQKKLKEKEVSEDDGPGDGDEYQKFVQTMLKKFGVKSPSELAPDKKKAFYDALDAGWEGDDEKPEPEDKEKDESLGDRVKGRMKAEQEEEEDDEGEQGVDDPNDMSDSEEDEDDESDAEPEKEEEEDDEPSGEKLDKLADLVIQKLKDKQAEEEDEEDAPEPTEAEGGKKEKIEVNPKVESAHLNPHRKSVWEEALRKVYEEKVPAPIPTVIKSVGKQLRDYALKSGGIDKDAFLRVSDVLQKGKIPKASLIPSDTDPREFVHDLMAKTFGWKFVEQEYGITFTRRRDYVESFQGGHKLEEHCGECGLGLHEGPIQTKMAKSKKGKITVTDHDSLEDAKKHLADMKKKGWNGIISQDGKPIKEEDEIDEIVKKRWKKGKYTVRDANTDKVIGTYNSGEEATKAMDKLMDTGKYSDLEVKMEEVEIDEGYEKAVLLSLEDEGIEGHFDTGKVVVAKRDVKRAKEVLDDDPDIRRTPKIVGEAKKIPKGLTDIPDDDPEQETASGMSRKDAAKLRKKKKNEDHDKTECPKCKGEGCEHCDDKGYHISEETLVEADDWLDKELKKVQHVWAKIGPNGKHLMDKRAKMNWFDKMDTKQSRSDYTDFEMKDAMDDYGIIPNLKAYNKDGSVTDKFKKTHKGYLGVAFKEETNLEKLERWGIRVRKEDYVNDPNSHLDPDTDKDYDLHPLSDPKYVPAYTDQKHQETEDKTGIGKNSKPTMSGKPKTAAGGDLDSGTVKRIEGDNPNKLSVGTKSGKPKTAKGKATAAKVSPVVKTKDGVSTQDHPVREGYMILPAIDRERYTEMRGLEGPFMTRSGKVVYYDAKAGAYYDRDSDMYLSYDEYASLDQESSAQKAAMKQGIFADPKSKEFKKMMKDKAKAEKHAKKNRLKNQYESLGMRFVRKHYQKDKDSL